jgi:hypothetical protein
MLKREVQPLNATLRKGRVAEVFGRHGLLSKKIFAVMCEADFECNLHDRPPGLLLLSCI